MEVVHFYKQKETRLPLKSVKRIIKKKKILNNYLASKFSTAMSILFVIVNRHKEV